MSKTPPDAEFPWPGCSESDGIMWFPRSLYSLEEAIEKWESLNGEDVDWFYSGGLRLRIVWMREAARDEYQEYIWVCERTHQQAFECWEIG